MALTAGVAAGLIVAALPAAQAGILDRISGGSQPVPTLSEVFAPRLVTVTADLRERNRIASSGLDVTEHAGRDYVEVVLHTPADLRLLESLGLPFEVRIPDLARREAEVQRANAEFAAANASTPLPSGRNQYRTLEDYEQELRDLAEDNPELVKLLVLPHQSIEGKDVIGVEIATDVNRTEGLVADDERPTFVLMGLHHAREWPSGEHTMEFAHDLVNGVNAGDERITRLVEGARTVLIPVVNPDGFEKSVNDGMTLDLRDVNEYDPLGGTTSILATPNNAYKRKNCRVHESIGAPLPVFCDLAKSPGGYGIGVDLNRNYGAFHGGPGADANPASPIFHGGHGFSEPETQNVRELVSARHVTMLISNHTFSNLILRPNGVNPQTIGPDGLPVGDAPDEDAMAELGARMAAQNGYANIHGWELYDTTGTTEDWSYNATGGYGYTFEIGPNEFHPPFPEVIDEYLGAGEYEGLGNREAYLIALEAALDPETHSIVAGHAVEGATLRLTRSGAVPTWEGSFTDVIDTELRVPAGGRFEWRTNPSTRPVAMGKRYHALAEEATDAMEHDGTLPLPTQSVDVDWTVTQSGGLATVTLDWLLPDDVDLEVHRRGEDGSLTQVASSGNFVGDKERATFVPEPGEYVIRVVNYAAVTGQPYTLTATTHATTTVTSTSLIEAWTLTCEKDGEVLARVPVVVDRGQRTVVDLGACGAATTPPKKGGKPATPGKPANPGNGKGRG
jgi:hypothetical protein